MLLLKAGRLTVDPWKYWADGSPKPGPGPLIVSLRRWLDERKNLMGNIQPLGVLLSSEQVLNEIKDDLDHFDVVALEFLTFTDGRPHSNAKWLRQRYGFKGEVRAVGNIGRDQYIALLRCGFDAFEVEGHETEENWSTAVRTISIAFQPGLDNQPTAMSLRKRRLTAMLA